MTTEDFEIDMETLTEWLVNKGPVTVAFDNKLLAASIGNKKQRLDLLNLNESEFVQYTLSRIPPAPPNYLTIAGLNKKGTYEGYTPSDLEAGANRCAIA